MLRFLSSSDAQGALRLMVCGSRGNGADRTRDPQFEQSLAQPARLSACTLATASTRAKLLNQHMGGAEQHSQLVGHVL
jgi:hypothetical protein